MDESLDSVEPAAQRFIAMNGAFNQLIDHTALLLNTQPTPSLPTMVSTRLLPPR